MDIIVRRGGLRNAPNPELYQDKSVLVDVAHADPQVPVVVEVIV